LQLTFPPASSIPEVSLIPLRLDDTGVPRPDPTAGAITLLEQRREHADPTIEKAPNGDWYVVRMQS
jgi:hypothetical protein